MFSCAWVLVMVLEMVQTTAAAAWGGKVVVHAKPPGRIDGLAGYVYAHRKWDSRVESELEEEESRERKRWRQEFAEKLEAKSHFDDSFFTANVSLGTPEQTFPLIIDTGSGDFGRHSGFRRRPPRHRQPHPEPPAPRAVVQAANRTSANIAASGVTGVLGLARTVEANIRGPHLPGTRERLTEALPGSGRFVSIDLRAADVDGDGDSDSSNGGSGEEGSAPGVRVGGGKGTRVTGASFNAVVDTGTTLMFIPAVAASAYWAEVSGARFEPAVDAWIFPCSETPRLPDITVEVGPAHDDDDGDGDDDDPDDTNDDDDDDDIFKAVVPGRYLDYGEIDSDGILAGGGGSGNGEGGPTGWEVAMCYGACSPRRG
ncbi:unnamed protein product [Parascedosporium putredinis]|uniref:Peptidase A1 domain-containing protein n=1 Tax=Parascedosporium putredinis TaxID=1442378 RepID=A0A9P1H7I5_9PEZI|nr:unnamed protein product [Parascedosporium putredinis]CAI7999713.1 unnamed protein product [Parascedosporium putredinis]